MIHEQPEASRLRVVEVGDQSEPGPLDDVDDRQSPQPQPQTHGQRCVTDRIATDKHVRTRRDRLARRTVVPRARHDLRVRPILGLVGARISDRRGPQLNDGELVACGRVHVDPDLLSGPHADPIDIA